MLQEGASRFSFVDVLVFFLQNLDFEYIGYWLQIDEGVELFEETMSKINEANSDNQREKLQVRISSFLSLFCL